MTADDIPEKINDDIPQQAIMERHAQIFQIGKEKITYAKNRSIRMSLRHQHCGHR